MYVGVEIKSLDEVFDNQYILSQNDFTSEEVNAIIDSMRWDINIFLKSKLCKRCKDKIDLQEK
jgi:hypothetical protein